MKKNAIATAVLLCTSTLFVTHNAIAQNAAFIGSVKDKQLHLSGALISIVGTDKSAVTDYQGQFELPKLDAGNYQLKITYLGYQPYFIDLTIDADEVKKIQPITLFAANNDTIEEIIAVGQIQRGEMAAANNQKNAKSIKNIISADGIGKLPDRNAAEAVQRIPGISIERDQGEGRFVAVRGLPAQWSSASINGDRLPTAEEETTSRATAFDFFPVS